MRRLNSSKNRYFKVFLATTGISAFEAMRLTQLILNEKASAILTPSVVLENNNEHLTRLLAEGLSLFRALLSPRQGVVLESCPEAAPGEPGSAAVQSVRPSAE